MPTDAGPSEAAARAMVEAWIGCEAGCNCCLCQIKAVLAALDAERANCATLTAELRADAGLLWRWTDLKLPVWARDEAGARAWHLGGVLNGIGAKEAKDGNSGDGR